jgi:hypothetical protein
VSVRVTRRSFLAAGAGALAGGVARGGAPLAAALASPGPRISTRWLGSVRHGERTIALPAGADMLGLEWEAPAGTDVQLRLRSRAGRWGEWVSAAGCGASRHPAAAAGAPARIIGSPVWSAGSGALQLRCTHALAAVRLHIVDVSGGLGARRLALARSLLGWDAARAAVALPAAAGTGQPPILARATWAQGMARPRVAPAYGAVRMAFVHHTESPNGYLPGEVPAMLRAIFAFHRDVRGWNDIGYNFVIDAFGRIFEARAGGVDEPVVGAQAGGYNLVSTGVALLGAFASRPISPAAARSLQALLAWKLSLHGVPARGRTRVRVNPAGAAYSRFPGGARVWLPHIAGHRDADSTDCPGGALYHELAGIRRGVQRLAPLPARATLALAPAKSPGAPAPSPGAPTTPATPPPAPAAPSLTGRVALLDGRPIAGAQIKLQARSVARRGQLVRELTLAEALTDASGSWSLPLASTGPLRPGAWLRAYYPGGLPGATGAAVSEPLRLPAGLSGPPRGPAPSAAGAPPPAR